MDEPGNGGQPGTNTTASCQLCGRSVPTGDAAGAVTWMVENTRRGTIWTCPDCARVHLRAIESKLDTEYW